MKPETSRPEFELAKPTPPQRSLTKIERQPGTDEGYDYFRDLYGPGRIREFYSRY